MLRHNFPINVIIPLQSLFLSISVNINSLFDLYEHMLMFLTQSRLQLISDAPKFRQPHIFHFLLLIPAQTEN